MAFYSIRKTIPAKTTEANPVTFSLSLKEKYIVDCWICFPRGCSWTVGGRVFYGIRRFFPTNPNEWIWGDNICVSIRQFIPMPAEVEKLKFVFISPEASWKHDILVMVWTTKKPSKPVEVSLVELIETIKELI